MQKGEEGDIFQMILDTDLITFTMAIMIKATIPIVTIPDILLGAVDNGFWKYIVLPEDFSVNMR